LLSQSLRIGAAYARVVKIKIHYSLGMRTLVHQSVLVLLLRPHRRKLPAIR